jgi:nucleotide-binding universal stress UspA family protein
MNAQSERIFNPFRRVLVPVMEGTDVTSALAFARLLGGRVHLLGLACLAEGTPLSSGTPIARRLRNYLERLRDNGDIKGRNTVRVSYNPWQDLLAFTAEESFDLLVLEWPGFLGTLSAPPAEILTRVQCDVALVRGPWKTQVYPPKVVMPLRGGPYAELALRIGLTLPHRELQVLNVVRPEASGVTEPSFHGLERIFPSLPEVKYQKLVAADVTGTILETAREADLLVVGASPRFLSADRAVPTLAEILLQQAPCPVVVVKTRRPLPAKFSGLEGELAGKGAISLLVDKWFAENTYRAEEFDDLDRLVRLKRDQNITISLALPALNEEETVGEVIRTIKGALMDEVPLLDEIVLIDSNSTDRTREIAAELGVPVYIHQELLPRYGARHGKGEALWKSLLVTNGDILAWIDTDIVNIHPRFVYGVLGPMLQDPRILFVKGFYQRPLRTGEITHSSGGGRVTELTARPLINLFYPELSGVIQPLSGEYGGRRSALERLPFFSGYGVETGLLIDMFETFGLSSIAQVDLLERIHHNQPLEALSKMSFVILQAVLRKLERRSGRPILEEVNKSMKLIRYVDGDYMLEVQDVAEAERPPMIEIPEYQAARAGVKST